MTYRYYSILRPIGIGTFPRNGMVDFANFDDRVMVVAIGRPAWGYLDYDRNSQRRKQTATIWCMGERYSKQKGECKW